MTRSFYCVCFFSFILLEVKSFKSEHNIILHRFVRSLNGTKQNISLYNNSPYRYNSKPPISNSNGSQWNHPSGLYGSRPENTDPNWYNSKQPNSTNLQLNNPEGYYNQGHLHQSNNLIGSRPQTMYGPNSYPNEYNSQPPVWTSSGPQWNNPGVSYNQEKNPKDIGWRPQNTSTYNIDPNRYNSRPSAFNGAAPQQVNPAPQWHNPGGNYYQGNLNYPNNQTSTISRPHNTSRYNGYNPKPTEWNNNQGGQYYAIPNDLTLQRYKRSVSNNHHNISWYHNDPNWHSGKESALNDTTSHQNSSNDYYYQGNVTNFNYTSSNGNLRWVRSAIHPSRHHNTSRHNSKESARNYTEPHWSNLSGNSYYGNMTNVNNRGNGSFRRRREIHHSRRHNVSWYNIDPNWYNIGPPARNGSDPQWNKPGGHYYWWNINNQNNAPYNRWHYNETRNKWPFNEEPSRHRHHHHHESGSPQFGRGHHGWPSPPHDSYPPPGGPGFNNMPPVVNGTVTNNAGSNNRTDLWEPESEEPSRHRHYHYHGSGSSQFGRGHHGWPSPPHDLDPPLGSPGLNNIPPVVNGTVTNDASSNNGTDLWVPEIEVGSNGTVLNGTNVNSTYPWGPELTDMNKFDESSNSPVPQ